MKAASTDYHPLKFLDRLEGNRHIVMLYDDEKYAYLVIARYFFNGFNRGQSCIFFTDEDPGPIESRLSKQGMEVEKYRQENRFRIFHTETSDSGKTDAMKTLKALRRESTRGMKGPFRFVGRTITDIESVDGISLGMKVEKIGQEHFDEFDNSQLCYYNINKLEATRRGEWVRGLLESHHQVIYASNPRKAVGFETILLEAAD
jgi:MEDS: MEthanogen/methylotroph, DcmR Sensory domain